MRTYTRTLCKPSRPTNKISVGLKFTIAHHLPVFTENQIEETGQPANGDQQTSSPPIVAIDREEEVILISSGEQMGQPSNNDHQMSPAPTALGNGEEDLKQTSFNAHRVQPVNNEHQMDPPTATFINEMEDLAQDHDYTYAHGQI